jgi:hypothetical protein
VSFPFSILKVIFISGTEKLHQTSCTMSSTIQNKGIFFNLPTFPDHDGKKYTAIVTGANGMSGSHVVDVLSESPQRWETIYAMSRKAPTSSNPHVKNIAADFLNQTPEELAALFKKEGVKADYIFFTSYIQPAPKPGEGLWSNDEELTELNGRVPLQESHN